MADPTEKNLTPEEGVAALVDKNLNVAGTNKELEEAARLLGSQGSDKEQGGEHVKQVIQKTGSSGVEEKLTNIGASNEEGATKVTKNQTGAGFDSAENEVEEPDQEREVLVAEVRGKLLSRVGADPDQIDRLLKSSSQEQLEQFSKNPDSVTLDNEKEKEPLNQTSTAEEDILDLVAELGSSIFNCAHQVSGGSYTPPATHSPDKSQEKEPENNR